MPKYVLTYHGPGHMPEGEEEMAQLMERWGAWFASIGEDLVDGGNPFSQARTVNADGSVSDGERADPTTGYSVVNAADIDGACSHAKGCPVLDHGGNVQVLEAIDM